MKHEHLPTGDRWSESLYAYDILSAVRNARDRGRKTWFRLRGDDAYRYEVYPGGRNIAWPIEMLRKRDERQAPLAAGHRCRHMWETHTSSEPTAAGMHIEQYRQCFKCGEIR